MRELPMLLNGEMVRATMAGRKIQTRRPVKPQPPSDAELPVYFDKRGWTWLCEDGVWPSLPARVRNPLGVPGDLLYVRETWAYWGINEGPGSLIVYRADGDKARRWQPSIHMPKWAARLWVRNTGVRVERLQGITEEDAIAEGTQAISVAAVPRQAAWTERQDFANIWDSIYANRGLGWEANPFVWVTSYEVIER